VVQGLNLFLKCCILNLHSLEFSLSFVLGLLSFGNNYRSTNQLLLEHRSFILSKLVLSLKIIKLAISFHELVVLSFDLFDVAGNDAIVTVLFVN